MQAVSKGVWLCIFSQSLFGIMYLFSAWMLPLNGTDVFVLRMIGSLFAILAILLPIMGLSGLKTFIRNELGSSWKRWLTFLMGSALAAGEWRRRKCGGGLLFISVSHGIWRLFMV